MMSLDGYVASRDGSETWMTAPDPGRDTADGRAAGRPARDQLRLARGPPTSTGSVRAGDQAGQATPLGQRNHRAARPARDTRFGSSNTSETLPSV